MAEIKPATVSPSSGAAQPVSNVTPIEATVASAPDKLQQLTRQIQISGTIAQLPDAGAVTLNTALGDLTLLLPQLIEAQKLKLLQQLIMMFQSQRPLTVVMQPGNPSAQAFMLLPQPGVATPTVADTFTSAQAVRPVQPLTPGLSLAAVVLPPNAALPANAATSLPEPVLPLTALTTQAAPQTKPGDVILPPPLAAGNLLAEAQSAPTVAANAPGASSIATPAAQPPANAPVPLSVLLQPGREITLQLNAVAPPGTALPAPVAADQVAATVIGNGPNGQLILKAGDATLYVRQNIAAPVGSNLLLTVAAAGPASPALLPVADSQQLGSLQQVLGALAQADPQLARQVIESVLPQSNAQLPTSLLFFMSALKQGDVRGWLGNGAADLLTRLGKFELIARLGEELKQAGQLVRDHVVGEWRSYPVPVQAEGRIYMLNLYVHQDGRRQAETDAAGRTGPAQVRFLIDMRMSRLGAMQLDGLVQPKKLDMIVRSEHALPQGLPQDLRDSYMRTLDALGYTGGLGFQTGRQHWLVIQREAPQSVMT